MSTTIDHETVAPLGFGCAQLFRLHSARERETVLGTAYDVGIRHFDVAPLYGLGLAEDELGRFLRSRRDHVTVATKFGLNPAAGAAAIRSIQGLARRLVNVVPPLKRYLQKRRRPLAASQSFDAKAAERSLEQSLRLLRVDFIDYFLLHEPTVMLVERDRPLEFLEHQRDRGRIRAFGVAGPLETVWPLLERFPSFGSVIQHPAPPVGSVPIAFPCCLPLTQFVYGSIANRIAIITARLDRSTAAKDAWLSQFGDHASRWRQALARILLLEQRVTSRESTILFGSTDSSHIREMAGPPSAEELAAIGLLRNWAGNTAQQVP